MTCFLSVMYSIIKVRLPSSCFILTNRLFPSKGEAVDIYFINLNSNSQDFLWFYSSPQGFLLPPVYTALCLFKCLLKELGSEHA